MVGPWKLPAIEITMTVAIPMDIGTSGKFEDPKDNVRK